jgi:hypothetical protein
MQARCGCSNLPCDANKYTNTHHLMLCHECCHCNHSSTSFARRRRRRQGTDGSVILWNSVERYSLYCLSSFIIVDIAALEGFDKQRVNNFRVLLLPSGCARNLLPPRLLPGAASTLTDHGETQTRIINTNVEVSHLCHQKILPPAGLEGQITLEHHDITMTRSHSLRPQVYWWCS